MKSACLTALLFSLVGFSAMAQTPDPTPEEDKLLLCAALAGNSGDAAASPAERDALWKEELKLNDAAARTLLQRGLSADAIYDIQEKYSEETQEIGLSQAECDALL